MSTQTKQEPTLDEVLRVLVPETPEDESLRNLRDRQHALENKRAELVAEKKRLVGLQEEIKAGKHTEQSYKNLKEVKRKITEVEADLSKINPKLKRLRALCHDREADKEEVDRAAKSRISDLESRVETLQQRLEKVSDEAADKEIKVKRLRKRLTEQESAREALRSLIKALQPLMRVARDTKDVEDKNIYSSTTASLWLGDLHDIREAATEAANALDRQ